MIKNKNNKIWKNPFRIANVANEKYSYALDERDAYKVRMIGVMGLMSLLALMVGIYNFTAQSLVVAILFAPFFVLVLLYNLINYILMSQMPSFSIFDHIQKVERFHKLGDRPRVAVLIPVAGESLSIVEKTLDAAIAMQYSNFRVFLLDDSKDGIYRELVAKKQATYFRRHDIGAHKKAGNLNALLWKLEGFEHSLVLDADFVPSPTMLDEMVPYAMPDVSIVQTPQHFDLSRKIYKRSKIEYGAALIQRDFYKLTQPARNRVSGAICVGTNALYRLEAIKQVGGYEGVGSSRTGGHSEDVFTGLKTLNAVNKNGNNYHITYVPIALAKGICPDDHLSFYKQQNRWATGSMQLIFSAKTMFSFHLTLSQKLCYFSNSLYYFYTIALLLSPLQLLILGLIDVDYSWQAMLLFVPSLVVNYFVIPYVTRRPVTPFAAALVVISNAYTFLQALYLLIIKKPLGWEVTGAKTNPKQHARFNEFKILSLTLFLSFYVSTMVVLVVNHKVGFNASIVMVAIFASSIVAHLMYLHHMFTAHPLKKLGVKLRSLTSYPKQDAAITVNE